MGKIGAIRRMQGERSRAAFLLRCAGWVLGFVLATGCLTALGRASITWKKAGPDFICFWSGGELLASGHSPYDPTLQARIQHEHGWDRATDGMGYFDFLPYYIPPSLLWPLFALLVPLGFSTARIAWLVINVELLFLTGYMLRNAVAGVSPRVPIVFVPLFGLSVLCVLVGQLSVLILFLMAAVWRLLQRGWDRSAGWILAWISVKPQLSAVFLVATLLWLVRQGRRRALEGFGTGALVLLAASTWAVPAWPFELLRVMTQSPVITLTFPKLGTTWFLVLRSLGAHGWLLWVPYAAVAVPFGWAVLRAALRRDAVIDDVVVWSILGAFFIAPTARPYDEPILIIPLLVLLGGRIPELAGALLVVGLLVAPYIHLWWWIPSSQHMAVHVWFFWIPLLLTGLWVGSQIYRAYGEPGLAVGEA